ncbi:unnamed protein product [Cunninghamella echinulata]
MSTPGNVRKLLRKQQTQRQQTKKIDHVFAKYDSQGRLGCVLCEIVIKSEQLWGPHLQSNQHKDKLAKLKAIKQQQQQKLLSKKRPLNDTLSSNGNGSGGDAALLSKRARFEQLEKEFEEEQQEEDSDQSMDESESDDNNDDENDSQEATENELPADFFDTPAATTKTTETTMKVGVQHDLPTGFFDNPDEEAKARQVANPKELQEQQLNEDYEAFKELIAEAVEETDKIQEQNEETILLDRDITLARQQLELDEKVQRLKFLRQQPTELLRQEIKKKQLDLQQQNHINKIDDDDDDSLWTAGLKSSVRQVMKKNDHKKQSQPIFDDDMDDEEEEDSENDEDDEDEKDWRAQHI